MRKADSQTPAGLGLPVIVFIVFLILKLTGLIDWSWWWVTSPLWIIFVIIGVVTLLYILVFTIRSRNK